MFRLNGDFAASATSKRPRRLWLAAVSVPLACLAVCARAQAQDASKDDMEQVTVTGTRLSQELSIALQKNANGVVSAISADDLGKFADTNVADALARLPGISVVNNQESGEGEYVTLRGLDATFNAYEINGVRVATTDPASRAVSLNVLPPNGLQAIVVSKTLTPDQDGDAIGGTIDFRTPTAFDYSKPIFRVFGNIGANSRALEQNEPAVDFGYQADMAHRFGPGDKFGFYITGYYNYIHGISEETENDGNWVPYLYTATLTQPVDSHSLQLPGIDLDYRRIKETRWGGDFSLDYRTDDQTLYLRGQYAKFFRTEDHNYFTIKNQQTPRLEQVNPNDTSLAQPQNSIIGVEPDGSKIYSYTTAQIVDANHDGIITDADRVGATASEGGYYSLLGNSGTWDPESYYVERSYETDDQISDLGTLDVGGTTRLSRLFLTYDAAYSFGQIGNPTDYEVDYKSDVNAAPFTSTGVSFSFPDPRFPIWQLPPSLQYTTSDDALLLPNGASHEKDISTDTRISAKLDARYDMEGQYGLDFLQAGFKYQQSRHKYNETLIYEGDLPFANLADASSLVLRDVPTILHGEYPFGAIFNMAAVESAIDAMGTSTFSLDDQNGDDTDDTESIYAAYGLANFKLHDLEIITGMRVELTDVDNTFWAEDVVSHWATTTHGYTELLPSITVNYRPNAEAVYRAAIWTSFSRPEYAYISGGQSVTRDAAGNIIAISQGNPDLKPAESTNFDASAEYYLGSASMFSAAVFYKMIRNFIFTNGQAVDATTPEGTIDVTQPQNGKDATVYGIEFNLAKTFDELPSPLDGFGIFANTTLQNSEADTGQAYRMGHKIPLINTSKYLINMALDYQKYGFEAKISLTYRSKFIEDLRDNAIDKWVQPNTNIDFHSRYDFDDGLAVDFDVSNLLDNWRYYTTRGPNPAYQKDYMEPGRVYMMRLAYSY